MESEKKGNKGLSFFVINEMKSACGILKLSVIFISVRILLIVRHQNWKVRVRVKLVLVKVISLTWYKLYMKVIKDITALAPNN